MFHCTHLATPSRQNKYKINSLSGTTLTTTEQILSRWGKWGIEDSSIPQVLLNSYSDHPDLLERSRHHVWLGCL